MNPPLISMDLNATVQRDVTYVSEIQEKLTHENLQLVSTAKTGKVHVLNTT